MRLNRTAWSLESGGCFEKVRHESTCAVESAVCTVASTAEAMREHWPRFAKQRIAKTPELQDQDGAAGRYCVALWDREKGEAQPDLMPRRSSPVLKASMEAEPLDYIDL